MPRFLLPQRKRITAAEPSNLRSLTPNLQDRAGRVTQKLSFSG